MRRPQMALSFLLAAALGTAGAVGLSGCRSQSEQQQPPTPVRVRPVHVAKGAQALRYSASIEARAQVPLSFQSNGEVKEILFFEQAGAIREVQLGDFVQGGTVLARIDDREYRDKVDGATAQVAGALASLQKGEADFRRASNLFETESITAPEYDRARKEYESAVAQVAGAKAQLAEAELALEHCTLTVPWDGVVLQRNIQLGEVVGPTTQAFTMADVSSVKAVFGIPDLILKDVRIGMPMELKTEAYGERRFPGQVTAVAPAADSQSRVFEIEVTLPNPEDLLKIGMIGSLVLPEADLAAAVVPLGAIVRDPKNPKGYALYVLGEKDGETVAQLRSVELGRVRGDEIAVLGGVRPGEKIVVNGATRVVNGKPVRVIP